MAPRGASPEPGGDLVQAGPLLVHDGRSVIDGDDREGFPWQAQFDSDITAARYPRCALGVTDTRLAVCCDGAARASTPGSSWRSWRGSCSRSTRSRPTADGGGSATLVHRGLLLTARTSITTSRRRHPGRS